MVKGMDHTPPSNTNDKHEQKVGLDNEGVDWGGDDRDGQGDDDATKDTTRNEGDGSFSKYDIDGEPSWLNEGLEGPNDDDIQV